MTGRRTIALLLVALLGSLFSTAAQGERKQYGELIVSLDGGIAPLRLPRDRPAPVSVRLAGGLQTADGSLLPRVARVEFELPAGGTVSTRGLPVCPARRLRNALPDAALAACRRALVGNGVLEAKLSLPNQGPITVRAPLLLFNGHGPDGNREILLHAYARRPPTVVVLPFALRRGAGGSGTVLAATLPSTLGPWPRLARFELTLSRRYRYRGRARSFLSASCPIPPSFTAGFISLARSTYTFVGGRQVDVAIVRGCRGA